MTLANKFAALLKNSSISIIISPKKASHYLAWKLLTLSNWITIELEIKEKIKKDIMIDICFN